MHIVYDLIGLNIILTIVMLILVVMQFVAQNLIAVLSKSTFVPFNFRRISMIYVYFLLSGLIVGTFFFAWWEWQSSECAFGYGLIKYSKFCFEDELNIFPVGFGTLMLCQFTLCLILLLLSKKIDK